LSDNPYRLTRAEVVVANGVAGEVARTRCTTREEEKPRIAAFFMSSSNRSRRQRAKKHRA